MGKQCILGIDVGTSAVKVLAAEIGPDGSIEIKGNGVVPTVGFYKGNVVDAPALAVAIRQAVDCAIMASGITISQAVMGIGGNALRSYNSLGSIAPSSIDAIDRNDIDRACRAAALTTLPEDHCLIHAVPTDYWVDGQKEQHEPIGQKGSRLETEVHMIAMPKALHDEIKKLLGEAGIQITSICSNAVAGSAIIPLQQRYNSLYLDVGAGVTDIALYQHGNIRLTASLPLGGDYITSDVMHALSIGRTRAEEIKRYYGRLNHMEYRGKSITVDSADNGKDKKVEFDFLHEVIESRIQEIISLTYHYLAPALTGYRPEQIFLTGGCAHMPKLIETYQEAFQLPIQIVLPETVREYSQPVNTACFGLLKLNAGSPVVKDRGKNSRSGIMEKIRTFFKAENQG